MQNRRDFIGSSLVATLTPLSFGALAQAWPSRPIKIIVPFSAGGVTDLVTREVAQQLGTKLGGGSFIVDNRAGSGGNLGATAVAKSVPDGYTLLAGTLSTYALNAGLYKNMGHDPLKDLVPIALTALVPIVLIVNPSMGVKDLKGFIAKLKAEPGKYNYASAGNGTSSHIAVQMFLARTGTDAVHVPYKGTANALAEVIANNVQFAVASPSVVRSFAANGKLVVLAAISPTRLKSLPLVPTIAEAGLPDIDVYSWNGLFAPAGTPSAILDRLHDAVEKIISDPEMTAKFEEQGTLPMLGRSRADVERYVKAENARWVPYVKKMGLSLD